MKTGENVLQQPCMKTDSYKVRESAPMIWMNKHVTSMEEIHLVCIFFHNDAFSTYSLLMNLIVAIIVFCDSLSH